MFSLGVELEMAVINANSGDLHLVQDYFTRLLTLKQQRGEEVRLDFLGGRAITVVSSDIVSSVDNGFNNLESSIGPIVDGPQKLQKLSSMIDRELTEVIAALAGEDAALLNFSEHPDTDIGDRYYRLARSPKPIYDYWVDYRGWNHMAGIDAKAHNGPTAGISWDKAVDGLNLLLALSPVFIALFANSPFAQGKIAGYKENRLNIWPEMFAPSRFACDRTLNRMPDRPFHDLRDYLYWMFGKGTRMQAIPIDGWGDYKKTGVLARVAGDPPLLTFLRGARWQGKQVNGQNPAQSAAISVSPSMGHLEFLQFSQFLDCRVRYSFADQRLELPVFLDALDSGGPLEELFEQNCTSVYLEGRAAGANFPDREMLQWGDIDVARSVVVSASALQTALLRDLKRSQTLVGGFHWQDLIQLRQQAITHGLSACYGDLSLEKLCRATLECAAESLDVDELWMLAYPFHVLRTGMNGADRALAAFDGMSGNSSERIRRLIMKRQVVSPAEFG